MDSRARLRAFVLAAGAVLLAALPGPLGAQERRLPRPRPDATPLPGPAPEGAPRATPVPTPEPLPDRERSLPRPGAAPTPRPAPEDEGGEGVEPGPEATPIRQLPRPDDTQAPPPGAEATPRPPTHPEPFARPPGHTGRRPLGPATEDEVIPVPDRWRIGFPDWERYPGKRGEIQYTRGRAIDPYHQNVLKGDYPLLGQHVFLSLTGVSSTLGELRRLPVPSGVSTERPGSFEAFGRGQQELFVQILSLQAELFHGEAAAFRPRDWAVRATPTFNANYLSTRERNLVNIDPRRGDDRYDDHVSLQEGFVEVKLADLSPHYDFVSVRGGIQGFTSDFRAFVFDDDNLGARVFGNLRSNRIQFNAAVFDQVEKDTNSGLNTFDRRHQQVAIANLYVQDFLTLGYTGQWSVHVNHDQATVHFDTNRFLVRPSQIGDVAPHQIDTVYLGWTGDGHFGRLNVTHAFYQVLGDDDRNPLAGRAVEVNAQMAAVELSVDRDWVRIKGSAFFASGDAEPDDDRGRAFDSILDAPVFAGGAFSYVLHQGIPVARAGVPLFNRMSLVPALRDKLEGQANHVNPGLFLVNGGFVLKLTPRLKGSVDASWFGFHHTEPLELLVHQPDIARSFGVDVNGGVSYRPKLSDNIIVLLGGALFLPGRAYDDVLSSACDTPGCGARSGTLYQAFGELKLTF